MIPALWLAVSAGSGAAQEALRMSLAGAQAAEARRTEAASLAHSNLKLGESAWSFGAGLGLQASDNLRGDSVDPQADLALRPGLESKMRLPLSELNTLSLAVAAGYALYIAHPEYDRPFVCPGSEVAFDLYIGDVWLTVHDRFDIVENAYLDPTVTGIADYERLDNTAGVSAVWDLNQIVLKFGGDYTLYRPLGNSATQNQTEGEAGIFSLNAGYAIMPGVHAGLEAGAALLHYSAPASSSAFSDGSQWNTGAFVEQKLTEYLQFRGDAGYTAFTPESGEAARFGQEFSGIYAQLCATHRLNQFLDYSLSGGRILNFGFFGGLLDQYFATVEGRWHLLRKTTLSTALNYQHGTQLGTAPETFDWFGPVVSASRLVTARLTAGLAYQYYRRTSSLPGRDYSANLLTATLLYKF